MSAGVAGLWLKVTGGSDPVYASQRYTWIGSRLSLSLPWSPPRSYVIVKQQYSFSGLDGTRIALEPFILLLRVRMQDVVALVLLAIPGSLSALPSVAADTVQPAPAPVVAPVLIPAALLPTGVGLGAGPAALQDTTKRKRTTAVEYSSFYNTRLKIHQVLSWTMLPLFALQYASGNQILEYGNAAPDWAKDVHGPTAGALAGVFAVNTITGAWNLWDSRKDPAGRTRRYIHSALMFIADAGFVYTGSLADEAESDPELREQHRNVAIASMGVATASWLMMLIWKD